jgi:anti-sigma factor RsiW
MKCREVENLVHGYLDGELDLAGNLEIERHLQSGAACKRAYESQLALRSAIRANDLSFRPPKHLQNRLRSALRAEAGTSRKMTWRWMYVAVPVTALALFVLLFSPRIFRPAAPGVDEMLTQEIISSHVRSLMVDHLTDVPSSDRHTVKPWFNGKLDFSPPVIDLAGQGFALTGGRLDYLHDRPVAALVYRRGQHPINLFVWPSSHTTEPEEKLMRQGFNLVRWTGAGLTWWAISDLNDEELEEFARMLKSQT